MKEGSSIELRLSSPRVELRLTYQDYLTVILVARSGVLGWKTPDASDNETYKRT